MCRHLGYLGPARPVAELLTAGENSLYRQSWAPRDMRGGGTVNADGYGVAWWGREDRLVRHRSATPIWSDPAVEGVLGAATSGAVVAAVRSATVGMPISEAACAPFVDEWWAFSHNGRVPGWPESLVPLASQLDVLDLMTMEAPTDSAVLWAAVRTRLRVMDPEVAIASVVREVAEAVPGARLNLLLGDGRVLVASAWDHALAVRSTPDAVYVSSEPLDDQAGWEQIPDRHLVVARIGEVTVTAI